MNRDMYKLILKAKNDDKFSKLDIYNKFSFYIKKLSRNLYYEEAETETQVYKFIKKKKEK